MQVRITRSFALAMFFAGAVGVFLWGGLTGELGPSAAKPTTADVVVIPPTKPTEPVAPPSPPAPPAPAPEPVPPSPTIELEYAIEEITGGVVLRVIPRSVNK